MKKRYYILLIFIMPVLLYSCSAPYSISTNVQLKYDWILTSTIVEGDLAGTDIPTKVFEDVALPCYTGSKWNFSEGGAGSYTINSSDTASCIKGTRKINWEVVTLKKSHYLQFFRYLAPKEVPTDRFTLYIAEITQLTKKQMILKYSIKYHDKVGDILFTFDVK